MTQDKPPEPDAVKLGFEKDCVTVSIKAILPVRALSGSVNPAESTGRSPRPSGRLDWSNLRSSPEIQIRAAPGCCLMDISGSKY